MNWTNTRPISVKKVNQILGNNKGWNSYWTKKAVRKLTNYRIARKQWAILKYARKTALVSLWVYMTTSWNSMRTKCMMWHENYFGSWEGTLEHIALKYKYKPTKVSSHATAEKFRRTAAFFGLTRRFPAYSALTFLFLFAKNYLRWNQRNIAKLYSSEFS